jgi:TATA-box binding protein (TBP) (component of TFIID and TFIIIB)
MQVKVVNVVMTLDLCRPVDLEELYRELQSRGVHVVYDEWQFPGLRWYDSEFTAIVFRTGKINVLGAKSLNFMETFKQVFGCHPKVLKTSEVLEIDFEKPINLDQLVINEHGVYEPSIVPFATLIFKNKQVLVFASGKVIVPGIKSKQQKEEVIEWLQTTVGKYSIS